MQIMDYFNKTHNIDIISLKRIVADMIMFGSKLYQQKWIVGQRIDNCNNVENIMKINLVRPE